MPAVLDAEGISSDRRATRLRRRLRAVSRRTGQGLETVLRLAGARRSADLRGGRRLPIPAEEQRAAHSRALHASIQERCRAMGYDNLAPIIWHKIANAQMEAEGNGSRPSSASPTSRTRSSRTTSNSYSWSGSRAAIARLTFHQSPELAFPMRTTSAGFSKILVDRTNRGIDPATIRHPTRWNWPVRLIRMFSFVGDTVLDPFLGTGTTTLAAALCGPEQHRLRDRPGIFQARCQTRSERDRRILQRREDRRGLD